MTKSGKSTDSFIYLGRSYRFFAEIRLVLTRVLSPNFASLKPPPCLSKTAQTWREKPANSSDMVRFSGKSFRLGEKIRLAAGSRQLALPAWRETRPLAALSHKKPGIHTKWIPGRNHLQPVCARGADLQRCCCRTRALLEVLDAAFNEGLELVASSELRDVLVEARTGALRVAHLAQDATIGAGNALDS